ADERILCGLASDRGSKSRNTPLAAAALLRLEAESTKPRHNCRGAKRSALTNADARRSLMSGDSPTSPPPQGGRGSMTSITADIAVAPRRSFQEVWVISLGHALTHWTPATFYLLLPLIGKELGLSYSEIGAVLTCQYLAGAIANIPGGIFVDTVGRKSLLMAASLFWIGFPYLIMG